MSEDLSLDDILAWGGDSVQCESAAVAESDSESDSESDVGGVGENDVEEVDAKQIVAHVERGGHGDYAYKYDPAVEAKEYSRSLLSAAELLAIVEKTRVGGYMTIAEVRNLVLQQTVKDSQEAREETRAIDPELMMQIDAHTNYRVFIAGDNVYTREELMGHYPFEACCTDPENVFAQQEVGVFPPAPPAAPECEYVARDFGDAEDFHTVSDLVARATGKTVRVRRPCRVVKTKVFLAKEKWDDFAMIGKLVRSIKTIIAPAIASGSPSALLSIFGGSVAAIQSAPPAHDREQLHDRELAVRSRECAILALEAREKAVQLREDAFRGVSAPSE